MEGSLSRSACPCRVSRAVVAARRPSLAAFFSRGVSCPRRRASPPRTGSCLPHGHSWVPPPHHCCHQNRHPPSSPPHYCHFCVHRNLCHRPPLSHLHGWPVEQPLPQENELPVRHRCLRGLYSGRLRAALPSHLPPLPPLPLLGTLPQPVVMTVRLHIFDPHVQEGCGLSRHQVTET